LETLNTVQPFADNIKKTFPLLFDQVKVGITFITPDHKIIQTNSTHAKMFAKSPEELIGNYCYKEFQRRDKTCPHCPSADAMRTRASKESKTKRIRDDGSSFDAKVTAYPLFTSDDEPLGFIEVVEDITTFEATKSKLEHTIALLRGTLDSTAGGILVIGSDGKIIIHNKQFLEMWRIEPAALEKGEDEVLLAHVRDQLKDPDSFISEIEKLYLDKNANGIALLSFKDGRIFERTTSPYVVGEKVEGCFFSFLDITERKEIQAKLEAQRQELSQVSSAGALGVLSGSIAHEINQPLSAIRSNAQAALRFLSMDTPDLDEVREALKDIVYDNTRADQVLKGIRALLKGEKEAEAFDINIEIFTVVRMLRSTAMHNDIFLDLKLSPETLITSGNATQFQQVAINIINNSIDELKELEGLQIIEIYTFSGEDGSPSLMISDSGPGIKKESLDAIFLPFNTSKKNGMGLGLSICKRLMDSCGGSISAVENPEGGAKFLVTMPQGREEDK
jgi:PAS domain S-box-containing protein